MYNAEANDVAVEFADATLYWPAVVKKGEHAKSKQTHGDGNVSSTDAKSNGKPADGVNGSSNDDAGDDNTDVCAQSTGRRVGEDYIVLRDINLSVKKGKSHSTCALGAACELIGICGAVGSGKSSLLSSLLGQLHIKKGRVAIGGSVAYVAQQAWIQSDTLANNILFEQERDEDFYERVLTACSLRHDITVLPAGEETEIGERGINLSGGQKQRINLARAVYADRDVYLLDDPLSAVDAHVGRSIFDKCIKGILEGRTILLVTHQLQYLPACDRVCFLENNRAAVGTHDELMKSNTSYRKTIEQHRRSQEEEEEEEQEAVVVDGDNDDSGEKKAKLEEATKSAADVQDQGEAAKDSGEDDEKEKKEKKKASGKLVEAEDVGQGGITLATYANYARAGGGVLLFLFILLLFGCAMFSKAYSDYYLGYWIRQGDGNSTTRGDRGDPSDNPDLDMHALVYGMTLVALLAFQGFKGFLFVRQTLAASSNLHKQVFERIIHAPMSFFDTTPTGRILNRFSRDLDEIDVRLPFVAEQFLQNSALLLITLCMIAYVFPWFLLALVPIAAFFFSVVHFFRPTQRQVKRLSSATRSPLVSQLSATLQGIHTIAAFEKKDAFLTKFFSTLDQHSKCFFFFHCSSRWFAFRLDYTTAMMILATSLLAVLLHGHVSPELAALAITYAMSMAGIFQYTTRLSAEVEARFTSVERIHRYGTETPQEVGFAVKTPGDLPKNWPAFGSIAFDRVKVSYRPGLPPVLRDVTLNIRPREKIGIVGRTGAGKSTIAMVLYRMMELTSGSISIDGVDIASVEASLLRSRLSIIPQDPVLFVGSIRYNLDPFEEHSDDDIWRALERAHVKALVSSLSQGLHAPVVENGENFSVGERQLLCMARALLRHSTILVMDEATAAIDTQTDALIQETIREAFQECTVLTVAHRLNTILDSDRILVMDGGQVAESLRRPSSSTTQTPTTLT
ncbi:hypothetical protein PTSG_00884 [Salpingoeca rosetta]|uniref:Uncharacterized protein n=1 Tax=Salpingoeca rosetta (strain ATCC 50818 / BSB-021) TaxID=946362 RepID=F2TXR9_SALR5|nr:uncharacterized protein PTSG_00884 [Salpingoeca rosetta]EGD76178.1 hypothetical protein PTSG_00884 [Salpingoeca rosetta]|eukprot:XP_004998353.1 hypothetical protein PTSG_00884 [Salpingoeca rosetta]